MVRTPGITLKLFKDNLAVGEECEVQKNLTEFSCFPVTLSAVCVRQQCSVELLEVALNKLSWLPARVRCGSMGLVYLVEKQACPYPS